MAVLTIKLVIYIKENDMPNKLQISDRLQIHELLRFNPREYTDPVPPWILDVLDRTILRDLAVISLEHTKAVHELNVKTIDKAIASLQKAKF